MRRKKSVNNLDDSSEMVQKPSSFTCIYDNGRTNKTNQSNKSISKKSTVKSKSKTLPVSELFTWENILKRIMDNSNNKNDSILREINPLDTFHNNKSLSEIITEKIMAYTNQIDLIQAYISITPIIEESELYKKNAELISLLISMYHLIWLQVHNKLHEFIQNEVINEELFDNKCNIKHLDQYINFLCTHLTANNFDSSDIKLSKYNPDHLMPTSDNCPSWLTVALNKQYKNKKNILYIDEFFSTMQQICIEICCIKSNYCMKITKELILSQTENINMLNYNFDTDTSYKGHEYKVFNNIISSYFLNTITEDNLSNAYPNKAILENTFQNIKIGFIEDKLHPKCQEEQIKKSIDSTLLFYKHKHLSKLNWETIVIFKELKEKLDLFLNIYAKIELTNKLPKCKF